MFHKKFQPRTLSALGLMLSVVFFFASCDGRTPTEPITDITWQWASLSETQPASQSITPDSENYTLTLSPDGTLNIKADCNSVMGSYELEGTSITIELGPSTMAFCGEQSLDLIYLELLDNVESYTLENGQLVLELKEGAGRMLFNAG
jgi:heat shock protein HslJ